MPVIPLYTELYIVYLFFFLLIMLLITHTSNTTLLFAQLAEIFQWRGDHDTIDSISKEDLDKIGQELADVTIYLIRLSDVSNTVLKAEAESLLQERTALQLNHNSQYQGSSV